MSEADQSWYRVSAEGVTLQIQVQPKASQEGLGPLQGERLKVRVNAPAVDGKANDAVIRLLARAFGLRRAGVEIRLGLHSRQKTVLLRALDEAALKARVTW